jgi:thymidylate kinase
MSTQQTFRDTVKRYRGVSIVSIKNGEVIVFDRNLDTTTVYGARGGDVGDACSKALADLIAEYGVK